MGICDVSLIGKYVLRCLNANLTVSPPLRVGRVSGSSFSSSCSGSDGFGGGATASFSFEVGGFGWGATASFAFEVGGCGGGAPSSPPSEIGGGM